MAARVGEGEGEELGRAGAGEETLLRREQLTKAAGGGDGLEQGRRSRGTNADPPRLEQRTGWIRGGAPTAEELGRRSSSDGGEVDGAEGGGGEVDRGGEDGVDAGGGME